MVCGRGEAGRYLKGTLDEFKRLCDDAIIVGNNTDEETEALIKSYGYWFYRDDREWGRFQPDIKTDLLRRVARLKPDWVLPLDADEVFGPSFTRVQLQELASTKALGFYFYIVNIWNDEDHYWKQGSFWNVRLFRYAPEYGLTFAKKNVHCGLAPPYAYRFGRYAPFVVRHYGLMRAADRAKKIERYDKYDPHGDKVGIGSYYDAIRGTGPGESYNETDVQKKVEAEVLRMKQDYDKTFDTSMAKPKKFVYVKRLKDGVILDIPSEHLEAHLKRGFELISEVSISTPTLNPIKPPVMGDPFECPICGFVASDGPALEAHKLEKVH